MRGIEDNQNGLFSYVSQEDRIGQDHPLRKVRENDAARSKCD